VAVSTSNTGAAIPEPAALVHPFIVDVTVYVPAVFTMIDGVLAPVFHNKTPDAKVDKVTVLSQLSTTITVGVVGVVFGAAKPDPVTLVQPSTVVVTLYVPAVFTSIDGVLAPVLHNNVPVAVVVSVDVLSQLLTTVTIGATVFGFIVTITSNLAALSQPFTVWLA
jgi:hypothetical protein